MRTAVTVTQKLPGRWIMTYSHKRLVPPSQAEGQDGRIMF